jgi:hypothetical protein
MGPPWSNVCAKRACEPNCPARAERAHWPGANPDLLGISAVQDAGTGTAIGLSMTRAILSAAIDSDWRLVSQERPCPVCGAEDTCGVHTVDKFACCSRAPSEWKLTNGSWLHRLQPAANTNGLRF